MKLNYQLPPRAVKRWDEWIGSRQLGDIAVAAQEAGFDMVSMTDHPFPYEPWVKAGRWYHPAALVHRPCLCHDLRAEPAYGVPRQVPGRCEVAVVSNGGGPIGGCMLLTAGVR
jgi:hypothetical protein